MAKSRGKDLAINTIIIGIGNFSTQIVSFLLLPLYTSILTTKEYGVYDLIITIATFILPIITLLMQESMFRFLIDCKNNKEKKIVISQTILYVSISTLVSLILARILNIFIEIPYLLIGIVYICSSILTELRNALVRGLGKLKLYTLINFISSLIHIVLNVIFIAIYRWGVYGLLFSSIIANTICSLVIFIKLKIYDYISIKSYNKKLMKDMIKYSIPLVPNSLSWTIVNLSDRLIISGVMGTAANGIYSMAYKFPNLMNTIYGFFYTAWKESSAKAISDEDKEEFFNKIFDMLIKVMFSVSLGIIVCMPLVFNIFIKESYKDAYLYIPILVIGMYYNNISGYYGGIFSAYKDTKIMGTTTILGAITNLVINILLIKFIGIYAAALSTMISCMVIFYYRKYKVKRYIKIESLKNTWGYLLLFITLVLYYINNNVVVKLINFIIVVIYAIYSNKEIIINLIRQFCLKFNKKIES